MPGLRAVMQALRTMPSTRTLHWEHWPLAQNMPCGASPLRCSEKLLTPLENKAELRASPSRPFMARPSKEKSARTAVWGTSMTGWLVILFMVFVSDASLWKHGKFELST